MDCRNRKIIYPLLPIHYYSDITQWVNFPALLRVTVSIPVHLAMKQQLSSTVESSYSVEAIEFRSIQVSQMNEWVLRVYLCIFFSASVKNTRVEARSLVYKTCSRACLNLSSREMRDRKKQDQKPWELRKETFKAGIVLTRWQRDGNTAKRNSF